MFTDAFAEPVSAPSTSARAPSVARVLSARELLSKLEGDERDELQRAMKARDLEAVRGIIARHTDGARIEREVYAPSLQPPRPMMRTGGGAKRRGFKRYADDEKQSPTPGEGPKP
jgi:hypothetical protein